ncbi:MAG: 2-oxoacid:acceptor oxidoreductase subunit alpha [Nitrospirae bacterium]|nr:2-oxoacid:acceptor oxidoreductase subunit alpha [Nitrospirota bacterium]
MAQTPSPEDRLDSPEGGKKRISRQQVREAIIRFAGDSGDGIQLTGSQFTNVTAIAGNDLSTFPDFPAEIRAPAGSVPGVSGYQIQFSSYDIHTPGDKAQVLIAFNPAALKANLNRIAPNATIIVNTDEFTEKNLEKAGYQANPLEDNSLSGLRVVKIPMTSITVKTIEDMASVSHKDRERCRNFFALGVVCWLYGRPLDPIERWIKNKFAKSPDFVEANTRVLKAGFNYAETVELFSVAYEVPPAKLRPGRYKNLTGYQGIVYGMVAATQKADLKLVYCSYPITPATEILQELSSLKNFGVITMQFEDEIASMNAAIGASFAGGLGATGTSGPGLALKSEALGLAVITELPIIVVDVQRAGPSTGMPTKTEQADLLFALFGRPSESPVPIVAVASASDAFDCAVEATRIAIKYMTPVILLTDLYTVFGSEPWRIADVNALPAMDVSPRLRALKAGSNGGFQPYARDEKTLARPWALPGTPGLEHRIGGLEKSNILGHISYDPPNHDLMVKMRAEKVARIAQELPPTEIVGKANPDLLVVSWGSTFGPIRTAVERSVEQGLSIGHLHLRWLNPLPSDLGSILKKHKRILVPENNLGQLSFLIRANYLVETIGYNRVTGQPFSVSELQDEFKKQLSKR